MLRRLTVEFEVALDGVTDVCEGFINRGPLGVTTGQRGTAHGHTVRVFQKSDLEFFLHREEFIADGDKRQCAVGHHGESHLV
jgi:hypothetical protein